MRSRGFSPPPEDDVGKGMLHATGSRTGLLRPALAAHAPAAAPVPCPGHIDAFKTKLINTTNVLMTRKRRPVKLGHGDGVCVPRSDRCHDRRQCRRHRRHRQ